MNDSLKRVVAILSLALCLTFWGDGLLWAQPRGGTREGQPPGGPPPHKEKLPFPEDDTAPFDVTLRQLPPVYIGHNAERIYELIRGRAADGKAGNETAGQYLARTRLDADITLVGTLSLGSTYAFQVTPAENFWDGREKTLKVYCELSAILANGTEDRRRRGLRVRYIPQMDNRFAYTDADGRRIEFEEVKFRDYTIAFEDSGQFPIERAIPPGAKQEIERQRKKGSPEHGSDDGSGREMIVASLKIQPAEAAQLKESMRVLAVGTLADPYVTSGTVERNGTPDKPGVYLARHEYLHIHLLELWFYDVVTGRVFLKMKAGDASPRS